MRITFCGTGAGGPVHHLRAKSSIHLQGERTQLLVDCGSGTVRRMGQARLEPSDLCAVIFSHLHSDHVIGLFSLLCERLGDETQPRVYGPKGTEQYVTAVKDALRNVATWAQDEEWEKIQAFDAESPARQKREVGEFTVSCIDVPHDDTLEESLAWRFEKGGDANHPVRTVVYSGDTCDPERVVEFANGADLLIHEVFSTAAVGRPAPLAGPQYRPSVKDRYLVAWLWNRLMLQVLQPKSEFKDLGLGRDGNVLDVLCDAERGEELLQVIQRPDEHIDLTNVQEALRTIPQQARSKMIKHSDALLKLLDSNGPMVSRIEEARGITSRLASLSLGKEHAPVSRDGLRAQQNETARTHSRATDIARAAEKAKVKHLVLTHLLPGERASELHAEVRQYFCGELTIAHDLLTLDIE